MMIQTKTHGFELAFEAFSVSNILNTAKYSERGELFLGIILWKGDLINNRGCHI